MTIRACLSKMGIVAARADGGPAPEELKILTRQFHVTLSAYAAKVEEQQGVKERTAFKRIDALLKKSPADAADPFTWNESYEVEQLLILLFEEKTLRKELGCRLLEAKSVLAEDLAEWYKSEAEKAESDTEAARALLSRLVNDLQWRYTVEEAKRGYTKEISKYTGVLFVFTSLLFALVILAPKLGMLLQSSTDLFLLPIAGLAGAWGASFSMLTSMRRRLARSSLDQLKIMRAGWIVAARALIGFGAASILYFFLVSGLLAGGAFPKIEQPPLTTPTAGEALPSPDARLPINAKALALLVVWCFLAGFSERLVPGILAKTEARAGVTRQRPSPDASSGDNRSATPAATPPATSSVATTTGQSQSPATS